MLEDVFSILATTPEKIRREIADLPLRKLKARPAPEKWSIQETLAHLDDVEGPGMRERVEAMVAQDRPVLLPFDQEQRAIDLKYNQKDPFKSLDHFARQRRVNLKWLKTLRPGELKRTGLHQAVGEVTAGEMIHEWAFHDLGHLKQILEVKRYALWPRMGNMRAFYKLQ